MGHELDACRVHGTDGELLADGFVREHEGGTLVVAAERFSGRWLEEGDPVVAHVLGEVSGQCTYDAVVVFAEAGRVGLRDLRLRERVQHRQAVRVAVELPHRVTAVVGDEGPEPLDPPLDVVVIDVSAHGLRFRCSAEMELGTRLVLPFTATRTPVDLLVEVVRHQTIRTDDAYGCRIVGAPERVTDELFRFVLDEQRRQLAERRDAR
ncbi:PilZ domain-containing protein [Cellulomonas carbonis]|uniref:PilZ domain-containing protein n=1 Tax=Cellulomonas carbonis T26 TaxID=947969 RepID=A0A0A0BTP7_9CELL|nr:PilZ domain-containing protein [Cellulomonas carbonis]KGM11753.1 hypothetical protein N868_07630 [Cellulomonas carbonis T26]GGB94685.1 hypothetical protein GCM10010972_04210 [Cellulomonas carbonis]